MRPIARLSIGLVSLALLVNSLAGDEPAKTQFKAIKLEALSKDGGQFDWSKADFLEALKGGEGWEMVANSDHAALFRKSKDGPKWEYKAVKLSNSPLAITGTKDVDAFGLILDRMAGDGYIPCAVNGLGEYILFKRVKDAKPTKTEFQTLMWGDVIKSKDAPANRFKETEFVETLNKHGKDGWEVGVCNINAVVFVKSAAKWEYKTVKVTKSPMSFLLQKGDDDEAATFTLILEGLEAKEWKPCACNPVGQEFLLKRELKKDKKE